jgi:hypothetical protein
MRPVDLAATSILGLRKPHGTRLRYMAGCKCVPCRAANSNYETGRAKLRRHGLWNGLVDATPSRHHILALSRSGVGRRTIRQITGISHSVIVKIKNGKRKQIRALTEKAILAVTRFDRRGATNIPAGETWRQIRWLLSEGFTKTRIAKELGCKTSALQLKKDFVWVKSAKAVENLYLRYHQ